MSYSFAHTIKPNKRAERPRRVIVFDVESHTDKGKDGKIYFTPFLWSYVYLVYKEGKGLELQTKKWGTQVAEFWEQVEGYTYSKTQLVMTSHHLEPDIIPLDMINHLTSRGWALKQFIAHNRIAIFKWCKGNKTILIINSGNIFPGSIALWGDYLGIEKLDMPGKNAPFEDWVTYCMRDTDILTKMWVNYIRFLDDHNLGNFQHTAASQSFTAFKHRFMSHSIAIHNSLDTQTLERKAYHGGRFQALVIGRPYAPRFWRVDINSMYGQIMRDTPLPYELRGYEDNPKLDKLYWLLDRYNVIANVEIDIPYPCIPSICYGKIKYVTGVQHVTLSTPELKYVIEHGKINQVYQVSWYKAGKILTEYTSYFLDLRTRYKAEGNRVYDQIAKLFCNSLYGKFGQYGYKTIEVGDCPRDLIAYEETYDVDTRKHREYYFYGGKVHTTNTLITAYNAFVAIAAHITAYGRLRLWQLMSMAGIDHVYHVATDSLIVDDRGLENLSGEIDNNEVGKMKIELEIHDLVIRAPNDMLIDGVDKIKGISKNARKEDEHTYTQIEWTSFKSMLKRGDLSKYYITEVTKTLQRTQFKELNHEGDFVNVSYSSTPLHILP